MGVHCMIFASRKLLFSDQRRGLLRSAEALPDPCPRIPIGRQSRGFRISLINPAKTDKLIRTFRFSAFVERH